MNRFTQFELVAVDLRNRNTINCYKCSKKWIWVLLSCLHKLSLAVAAGCARNANIRIGKYDWKLEQILVQILAAANVQIGGARQAAVTSQPLHVCKVPQLKSGSLYPHFSNNCTLSWVRAILKAQECCEVKLSCFKGIGNPTDIHGSWGTWLGVC